MKRIFQAMTVVTIISIVTRLMAFLFKIYLSRTLGAEVLGVYQIAMSIFVLVMSLTSSGIPTALSRHIAGLRAKGDDIGARGMLTSGLIVSTITSIAIILVCYLFPNITKLLFTDVRCYEMFTIMLPALFTTSIYGIIRSYFWGNKKYLIYSISELLEEVMSIVVVVITLTFSLFSNSITKEMAMAFVISDYIATTVLVVTFFMVGGKLTKPSLLKPLFRSSTPITSTRILGSMLSSMMALLLPLLLVRQGMTSGEATAAYGRASGMVMPLVFIPSTIISSLVVVMSPELASNKAKGIDISRSVSLALTITIVIACIFLSIFMGVGDRICNILYNDPIASKYMLVASLIMLPMSINQILVALLNTLGYENKTFLIHLIGGIVLSVMILVSTKYIGIYAYFVSLIIFHTLTCMLYLMVLKKVTHISNSDKKLYIMEIAMAFCLAIALKSIKIGKINDIIYIFITSLVVFFIYIFVNMKSKKLTINLLKKR